MLRSLTHKESIVEAKAAWWIKRPSRCSMVQNLLKTTKTGLIDVSLEYPIGESYGFSAFRSAAEVFQTKIRSQTCSLDAEWRS